MEKIIFTVSAERIRTKPRMTRQDVWKKRPCVTNWYEWKNNVAWTYKQKGGWCFDCPVSVKFWFRLKASKKERRDLDNIIKGIIEALSGGVAFVDDSIEYVRRYEDADVEFVKVGVESATITIGSYEESKNGNV